MSRIHLKLENVARLDRQNPKELTGNIQTDMNGLGLFSQQIPCDLAEIPETQGLRCGEGALASFLQRDSLLPPKANSVFFA